MHPLDIIFTVYLILGICYFILYKLEKANKPANKVKNKVEDIKEKEVLYKEVRKFDNKNILNKLKKVNKFLNKKSS